MTGNWRDHAACKGATQTFYAEGVGAGTVLAIAKAKATCATCPVATQCLDYALANHEPYGVWGGKSPGERQFIVARRAGVPLRPIRHGTEAGYTAHRRRNEPPCEPCRVAFNARQQTRRQQREQGAA